jgi:hypothetical protein
MSPAQALQAEARFAVSPRDTALVASVGAFAHIQADAARIEALRRDPGTLPGRDLPASFLKHSDEQSVCGFAAMLQAIRESGQAIEAFREWGVVGAPRYPGRICGAAAMARFFDQGVRGISPHAIPHLSLHSLSGVISVGLGLGGPNLGAGGGPNALAEGFMTAFSMLSQRRLPGLWLVVSAWNREPLPQKNGRATIEGKCHAVAIALSPVDGVAEGLCFSFDSTGARQGGASPCPNASDGDEAAGSVTGLADALFRQRRAPLGAVLWRLPLEWGAEVLLAKNHSS